MHKRYVKTRRKGALSRAAGRLVDVTVRRSRNKQDPKTMYVIEGPDIAAKAINKLVEQFDESAR